MEAATFRNSVGTATRESVASPLLRLQSDDRLVAMTRRGNQGAFELLVSRYQSKLLSFCRHMLGNREDAEDVLQEVFASAYTAMLADNRPIMVKPWLYRIARNRSLNHMRKAKPIGVDSMDIHVSRFGLTTADQAHRNDEFRNLMGDISVLPETQRTALVLREVEGLGYEQIAEAMETTIPSVKSLLVRARVALAEMSEARGLTCNEVRLELGEIAEGVTRRMSPPIRRHVKTCNSCKEFKAQLTATDAALSAFAPIGVILATKNVVMSQLGITGSGSAAAGGSTAAGTTAVASGGGIAGTISAGATTIANKAAAGLAAAAIVTAGAAQVGNVASTSSVAAQRAPAATIAAAQKAAAPVTIAAVATPAVDASTVSPAADITATPDASSLTPADTSAASSAPTVTTTDSVSLPADITAGDTGSAATDAAVDAGAAGSDPTAPVDPAGSTDAPAIP